MRRADPRRMDDESAYYASQAPDRAEVAALRGPTVLEFGTDWCGHCLAARPFVAQALATAPGLRHLKIEDGPGRALGRAYRVKLWPTLVFLRDGEELARVVRPLGAGAIAAALDRIHATDAAPATE
jgi:thioredoxin 1